MAAFRAVTAIGLYCLLGLGGVEAESVHLPVKIDRGVAVPMRDRVVLRADVYHPDVEGKYPVLLTRTPYNKDQIIKFGLRAAALGYVVVVQDVRGRFSSEGEWYPFSHESEDGYDTVEWAAALPYSNQKVGMFGESYVGATQMLAAIAHPPHLAGICPGFTPSNYHNGWVYQGGAFEQWFNQSWTSGLAQDTLRRLAQKGSKSLLEREGLPLQNYQLFSLPPLGDASGMTAALAPYYADWLAHPNYDAYWKAISIEEHYPDIKVPALITAAWYDLFQAGSLRNYEGIKAHGGSEASRSGTRLLIVIGGHAGSARKIGDVDFGPQATLYPDDNVTLAWYDALFKGSKNELTSGKQVKYFLLGANDWHETGNWPPPEARMKTFYLSSAGKANSSHGDGHLSVERPESDSADQYVYDPAKPVPTNGGSLCCDGSILNGPQDQRQNEARGDVLVYSTPPLTENLTVVGPVAVDLYASSSAVDTDFTARLVDVRPDGYAQNLTEGIVRARYRDSQERPSRMVPGQVYRFSVDLWSTGNLFKKGHILRLQISSSNSPRFDRNLNTGEPFGSGSKFISATNRILHDASHPSALRLSVIAN
jgi:putative CocE/NonD family hydrolase